MQEQNLSPDKTSIEEVSNAAIALLTKLISIPSFSKEEDKTSDLIQDFFTVKGIKTFRRFNNVVAHNKHYDSNLPTILLNSHHDTVKPNVGYTLNPLNPIEKDEKLFGLGSNDAGGALVSLIATFLYFYEKPHLKYNLIIAATAEEEISGKNGVEAILPELGKIDFAIVGEPTLMQLAISEKGLLVLDCVAHGKSGHAAREEGDNAIYKAMTDIEWFRTFQFPKISETLGSVKMQVTGIKAGTQHNVVPAQCEFVVDVRLTDAYTNEEVLNIIREHISCEVTPRSMRLKPSFISSTHPIVKAGIKWKRNIFGSSTTSDRALMNFPSLKLGPGDSARSHSADEFIYLNEIKEGIKLYINILQEVI